MFGPGRTILVVGAVALVGCRSDDAASSRTDVGTAVDTTEVTIVDGEPSDAEPTTTPERSAPVASPPATSEESTVDTVVAGSVAPPLATLAPGPSSAVTRPDDAEELVLLEGLAEGEDGWGDDSSWEVELPGEASATVIGGAGVMETDARGTHEWVRAIAEGSSHDDASVFARIAPVRSDEGTVFIGLRGDGGWRDAFQYVPQTGVVLEYGYSPVFEGEIVLIVLDGPEQRRVGPVIGPVLSDGESADIRFEVVGDRARVKVWRSGDDEPPGWAVEVDGVSTTGGVVQIAYRDGVARSVAWDQLTLTPWS